MARNTEKRQLCILWLCIGCFAFYVYVCALCGCSACMGQKRAADPLELELQLGATL